MKSTKQNKTATQEEVTKKLETIEYFMEQGTANASSTAKNNLFLSVLKDFSPSTPENSTPNKPISLFSIS